MKLVNGRHVRVAAAVVPAAVVGVMVVAAAAAATEVGIGTDPLCFAGITLRMSKDLRSGHACDS
jgi:hypothetical protein